MKSNRSIYTNKEILNDEQFILWCLNPTKELDKHWQMWLKEHPDQVNVIDQAKEIASSIRLNDDKMPEDECQQLHSRILQDIRKRQKNT